MYTKIIYVYIFSSATRLKDVIFMGINEKNIWVFCSIWSSSRSLNAYTKICTNIIPNLNHNFIWNNDHFFLSFPSLLRIRLLSKYQQRVRTGFIWRMALFLKYAWSVILCCVDQHNLHLMPCIKEMHVRNNNIFTIHVYKFA